MDGNNKKSLIQVAYASSIGIAMVIMVFGGLYLGSYLDRRWGTGYKFTLILLIVGIIAGFRNIYKFIKLNFADEKTVITCIKSEPHRKRPPPKKA
jgi:ATP synthase protein I